MNRLYQSVRGVFCCYCVSILLVCEVSAQCNQRYTWATWETFTGNKATGTIKVNAKLLGVSMAANYAFASTPSITNFAAFSKFEGYTDIPNATVPRTTWSIGAGGETTMCFSEPVTNPALLLASLGHGGLRVNLRFSEPYTVLHDAVNMKFIDATTLSGAEGYAIIVFPGIFTCLTIYSETPEFYTNITWGIQVPLAPIAITDKIVDCGGVTLTASGGVAYKWNGGQQPTSAINTVTTTSIYSVTATDQNGCTTIVLKDVPVIPKPALTSTVSRTICQGESLAGYTLAGTYVDQLKTRYGCDSTRVLQLSIVAQPKVVLAANHAVCSGQSVELRPVVTTANLPVQYSWSTGERTATSSAKLAGLYSLTVSDGTCTAEASTQVTVNPLPTVLPDEVRPCDGALLSVGGISSGLTYLWEPSGETTETIQARQIGTYRVRTTNSFSCSAVRTIQVTGSCGTAVFAPTGFTPNQDQVNDIFSVLVKNGMVVSLCVYNRWGDVVYSEESANPQWNGRHKGEDCLPGTYTYRLAYTILSSNEVLTHEGVVHLVR